MLIREFCEPISMKLQAPSYLRETFDPIEDRGNIEACKNGLVNSI